jgi:ankyrin repeat protein
VDICTAASIGDFERVIELLDQDPSLSNRVSEYVTYYLGSGAPLKNAAARGHIEIVKLLLERGADPNLPEEGIAPHGHALYSAVYNRHFEVAKLLLERGAYPNPPVESSADALSIAKMNNDEKMVSLLLSFGAARSIDILSHYGDIETAAAVFAVKPELADDPHVLSQAAGNGNEAFVRLLLHHQPDLAKKVSGVAKTRELSEFLYERGANPNHRDWLEITPLHYCAGEGKLEKATMLIDHGADIHARDENLCSTPLGWAAKNGKKQMVELLLRRGAQVSLPDDPPWATPLAWATRRGHREIVELLEGYEKTGALPTAPPEPEPTADPISGRWTDDRGVVFELQFDGISTVSGTVSPNHAVIETGAFDPKTGVLTLEGDARGSDGSMYHFFIEGTVDKGIASGTYSFRTSREDKGEFTVTKE